MNELEFVGRVFKNKTNKQFNIVPIKRELSKEVLKLFNSKDIIGFRLEIINTYNKDSPEMAPRLKVRTIEEIKEYRKENNHKNYLKRK